MVQQGFWSTFYWMVQTITGGSLSLHKVLLCMFFHGSIGVCGQHNYGWKWQRSYVDSKGSIGKEVQVERFGTIKAFSGSRNCKIFSWNFFKLKEYTLELLADTGQLSCKLVKLPMEPGLKLSQDEGELLEDPSSWRRLIGRLLYLILTRPDLNYPMHRLSQFLAAPRDKHLQAAHRVLQYIKEAPRQGLFLPTNSKMQLKSLADADWATCPDTRRSVTGFVSCLLLCWSHGGQRGIL